MKPLNINELTIEQKIGQMLLCRRPIDQEDKEFILELLRNKCLGGIHLLYKMKDDIPEYQEAAGYPLLICENMENGLQEIQLPCPLAIGATRSEELAYEFGRITAIEAKAIGYNVAFGPILDIAMNPLSNCVGTRSFGGDKEIVAKMGTAAIRGYQEQGMIVTGKHFPGFGESAVDSHLGMVYLSGDEQQLIERELFPYIKAMNEADLSGVMVGHITAAKVDPELPASISPRLIGLLRKCGYDGLVMTDSLAMVGITNRFGVEECHGLAMAAGNDMVMTSYRIGAKAAYEYMLKAYRDKKVTEEQINAAAKRVLAAQAKTLKQATQSGLAQKDRSLAINMSRQSITVNLSGVDSAVISKEEKHLFIVQVGNIFVNPESGEIDEDKSHLKKIETLIKENYPNSDIIKVEEFPSRDSMEHVCSRTMDYDSVVMVLYNRTAAYLGSSDLTNRMIALIEAVAHKITAIILFGNPYAARQLPSVPRIIFGYSGGDCEESVIEVVTGKMEPKGELPVKVDFRK